MREIWGVLLRECDGAAEVVPLTPPLLNDTIIVSVPDMPVGSWVMSLCTSLFTRYYSVVMLDSKIIRNT